MIRTTALALLLAASFTAHANPEAAAKPDPAKGKPIAEAVCGACHGTDGNSLAAANPNLAGQIPEYIVKQLSNFKPGADGKAPLRNNAIMAGMAATLATEDDMKNVAAYFAAQTLKPQVANDEKLVAQGQKLWRAGDVKKGIPACAGCHGAAGAGLPAQFPRLAGQWAEYTENQLKTFRSGERGNDPEKMMRTIAAKLSDPEIKAVAEYIAGLR